MMFLSCVNTLLLFLVALSLCPGTWGAAKKVCYPVVGCFSLDHPFHQSTYLPNSPENVAVKFKLFTPKNKEKPKSLDYTSAATVTSSHFNNKLPLKIIIHGYMSKTRDNWVPALKNEILKKEPANVIVVDWSSGALGLYWQCAANTRLVATETRLLLGLMVKHVGLNLDKVHVIGHSLGAHIAGYVGQGMKSKIGRITALDAADPNFNGVPLDARVDSSDAKFVDAIHTDAGKFSKMATGLGLMESYGHVDFYPNGGIQQPGCNGRISNVIDKIFGKRSLAKIFACNHYMSHQLFTKSINAHCKFESVPCSNYAKYAKGQCTSCGSQGCSQMGYSADKFPGRGAQYLKTVDKAPFCGHRYLLKVTFADSVPKVGLKVHFAGALTSSSLMEVKTSESKLDKKTLQAPVLSKNHKDPISAVELELMDSSYFTWNSLTITAIDITDVANGHRYVSHIGTSVVNDSGTMKVPVKRVN